MESLQENRPGWLREKMGFDALVAYGMVFLTIPMMTEALNVNAAAADAAAADADALAKLAAASEQAGARATAAAANYPLAAGALFKEAAGDYGAPAHPRPHRNRVPSVGTGAVDAGAVRAQGCPQA